GHVSMRSALDRRLPAGTSWCRQGNRRDGDEAAGVSKLEIHPQETPCGGRAPVADEPVRELQAGASVALGGPRGMMVTRTLPNRTRRMIGAWCFVDFYGPADLTNAPGMRAAPAPHLG